MKKKLINRFDVLIIILIFCLAGGALLFLKSKKNTELQNKKTVLVTLISERPLEDKLALFKEGEPLISLNKKLQNSSIKSVKLTKKMIEEVNEDGVLVAKEDPYNFKMTIVAKIQADSQGAYLLFGSDTIKAGKEMYIKTESAFVLGEITNVEVVE